MIIDPYNVVVRLDKVFCKDTESLHSSDKFALIGAVDTGREHKAFILPTRRINDWETWLIPPDLSVIFAGGVPAGEVTISFAAWDLDENDGWLENKDEILAACRGIETGLAAAGYAPAAAAMEAFVDIASSVIDKFVSWDKDDLLLTYRQVVSCTSPFDRAAHQHFEVPFSRHEDVDYSGFDYTLSYDVESRTQAIFGTADQTPVAYEPVTRAGQRAWHGSWVGDGVAAEIGEPANSSERFATPVLSVVVSEDVGDQLVTTTSYPPTPGDDGGPTGIEVLRQGLPRRRFHDRVEADAPDFGNVLVGGNDDDRIRLDPPVNSADLDPTQQIDLPDGPTYLGDHLELDGAASLELFRRSDAFNPTPVYLLRYRRPTGSFARAVDPTAHDVMLHQRPNL